MIICSNLKCIKNSFGIATINLYITFDDDLQNFADEAMNIQLLLNIVDKATNIKLKLFHIMGCPTFRVRNAY